MKRTIVPAFMALALAGGSLFAQAEGTGTGGRLPLKFGISIAPADSGGAPDGMTAPAFTEGGKETGAGCEGGLWVAPEAFKFAGTPVRMPPADDEKLTPGAAAPDQPYARGKPFSRPDELSGANSNVPF